MAIWAIKGYDDYYSGLHGMAEYKVIEGTEADANDYGLEMSYSVIESYSEIEEALEDNIEDELSYYDFEDDDEEEATRDLIRSRTYKQDTAWDIYQLDKNKLPTLDFNELGEMFYNDPDEFLEKYAIN